MSGPNPELEKAERKVIRSLCDEELRALGNGHDVAKCLQSLKNLDGICIALLKKYDPDNGFEEGVTDEFTELYRLFGSFFEQGKMAMFFSTYCKDVIRLMSGGRTLDDVINPYGDALSLCSIVIGMLEYGKGIDEIMQDAIETQDDFNAWKDYLLQTAADNDG